MRRVAVTGVGIVSCIGNNKNEVLASLREGRSGITFSEEYKEMGFRSQVHGKPTIDLNESVDRRWRRFMGDGAAYNYVAMQQAVEDAELDSSEVSNERTAMIMGSGGPSTSNQIAAADSARTRGPRKVGPFMVPRTMSSTNSATLATAFQIKGLSYSISSACSTSAHCIGNGAELIQLNKADVVFAGGGEELHWSLSVLFDAMPALSSAYNDVPERASRPYDANRDGFVIAGGGGVVVLEEMARARARGATIYGELMGYGATSDGFDMVQPSGEGAARCMRLAISNLDRPVDYINTHGTSTPVGDIKELEAIREVFTDCDQIPYFGSTKSLTGHSLGATGVQEAIYSLLMMENNFLSASANIEQLDPSVGEMPLLRERLDDADVNCVLSNSFGFGGTNASLAFARAEY
ncbi:MAG: beta-ketoacyl-[acyl-carrier-protein] synthase I [Rhodospirillaceae bacterium TMED8]|nr:beta-ketoacyl-[acyl-carrier-protein] synthase I [Magnetovibrio sp.]OUT50446.1 MAG: beta-ketoacyl-[acyl-carrier-protein] synthase I [Rhodospirillaceae bacterium TMED8]